MVSNLMRIIPKLGIAPAILLIVFLIKLLFPIFSDPDFYWHLKTGEYIFSHHALPSGELFTYTQQGRPLVHSEWLFETILYVIYKDFGFAGVSVFVATLYTSCWYVSYLTCRLILNDEAKAIISTLFFCGGFAAIAPRPHLITFLFFALTLFLIADFKYRNGLQRMWVFPPLMLVWANMHGGYFLGLVLMGLFVASEWTIWLVRDDAQSSAKSRLKILTGIAVTGFLATAVNPDFVRLWSYPFAAIVSSGDTTAITEWQSPDFHNPLFQYFLATVFGFWCSAIYASRRPDLTELAIPLVFLLGAFFSVRNVPLAALAMAPFSTVFIGPLVTAASRSVLSPAYVASSTVQSAPVSPFLDRLRRLGAASNQQVGGEEFALNWSLVGMAVLAVAFIYPAHEKTMQDDLARLLPVKATDFIVEHHIDGRMLNTYHTGGYLIYRLYPAQKVFVYGRTDFFSPGFLNETIGIYAGSPRWKSLFDKYGFDYVICESAAPLRQLLLEGHEFRLVYDDGLHSVLLRDEDRFRSLIRDYARLPATASRI